MVDTVERFFASWPVGDSKTQEGAHPSSVLAFSVEPMFGAALDEYARLCASTVTAPSQSPEWLAAWSRNVNADSLIVFARVGATLVFAMPLEVVRDGFFRIARPPGGSHANGSFFPAMPAFRGVSGPEARVNAAFRALTKARPDIDVVALERLAPTLDGLDNPMSALPRTDSPNPALAADLGDGFEPLVERMSGKRKRKKLRAQLRKFEAAGGYRCVRAGTPEEADRLLSALFAMKHTRFRKMGVADVFAPPEINAFFHALFAGEAKNDAPRFFLSGLEVGGKLRAVAAYSRTGGRIVCDFASFTEDELYSASPGEFLFFHDIEQASAGGLKIFDFSVGDEPYKRAWCEIETRQFDVLVPLTAKGHAAAAIRRAKARAKSVVKNNPVAWRLVRVTRAVGAAKTAHAGNDEVR
jgi:CelD/BcsL family acetyltransferase involved in cellulose biosynthesis